MFLDTDDEKVLAGEFGETRQRMMELLVALGKVFGAEKMIPISSAQVSGASYKTIGDWGLEWLQGLDARVSVPAVLNPVGMARDRWQEMGISSEFADKQNQILSAFQRLGVKLECTCTPYYLNLVQYGDHLAWSESSAVSYANSVIGARTNREGGPGALAAALVGKTPYYGLHIVANRRPEVVIQVSDAPKTQDTAWFGALGHLVGPLVGTRIPFFTGIRPSRDQLKALGSGMAATGAVALYHVDGITPETRVFHFDTAALEAIPVELAAVDAVFSNQEVEVDAVAVGCPHCSPDELNRIAGLLTGKHTKKPFYVFAAKGVITAEQETVARIEKSGARVYADTCMVVSPALERYNHLMVNSGKALAYVQNLCGGAAHLGTLEECVAEATR